MLSTMPSLSVIRHWLMLAHEEMSRDDRCQDLLHRLLAATRDWWGFAAVVDVSGYRKMEDVANVEESG